MIVIPKRIKGENEKYFQCPARYSVLTGRLFGMISSNFLCYICINGNIVKLL